MDIDFKNALSSKVGLKHGLKKPVFLNFLKKNQSLVEKVFESKNKSGYAFVDLPDDKTTLDEVKKFAAEQKNKWENIVVLGIGGSALGGIALKEALLNPYDTKRKPRLFFLDNIDPDATSDLFSSINLKKTLVIVISKSGGTIEPMALFGLIKARVPKKNLVFITGPKENSLREMGGHENIRMFEIPQKIEGRYSVLTNVGLIPAALAGIKVDALLRGAKKMRDLIKKSAPSKNPALILASLQYLLDQKKGKPITVMMPYSSKLSSFSDWYRQLLAESIGKNSKAGPTPINALGTADQHSQLQLYSAGPNNKFFIFLRVLNFKNTLKLSANLPKKLGFLNKKSLNQIIDAACNGTTQSLAQNKRPSITLSLPKVDEETLGALFMLFEFQVALLGLMYKVNAFNQPGVEKGKRITKQILSRK
jgi:glucose-6-phosphate isomerase